MRWKDFDRALHAELIDEAKRLRRDPDQLRLQGSDIDPLAIQHAQANARAAGVEHDIQWSVENFSTARPLWPAGLLVTNPPYDERLKVEQIVAVYRRLGDALKQNWDGTTAFILAGNAEAGKHIGLRRRRRIPLFNGPIECRLLKFPLYGFVAAAPTTSNESLADEAAEPVTQRRTARTWDDQVNALRARLERMAKHSGQVGTAPWDHLLPGV